MTSTPELTEEELDQAFDEVLAAVEAGERVRAMALATEALRRGLEEPLVQLLAAESLEEQGRLDEANVLLRQVLNAAPEEAEAWRRFGALLAKQGQLGEARHALDVALTKNPDVYPTLITAGLVAFRQADLAGADQFYQRAATLAPTAAEPWAARATIAARREDAKAAREFAERALALAPGSLSAELAIARSDLLDGAPDRAAERMTRVLAQSLEPEARVSVHDLRAEAFDLLDRPGDAFADYTARNRVLERVTAPRIEREITERPVDQARRLADYFGAAPAALWRGRAEPDEIGAGVASGHVFLLGFPRSGTTLLEKALGCHPGVITLEEIDHLGNAGADLLAAAASLDALAVLTPAEAERRRKAYWSGVRETVGEDFAGKVALDKLPLHTRALPLIAKLFPDAKILFALRDPRDVVLSCFRRRFQMNAAMYEFLNLTGAARYYDQIMSLARIYRDLLPLDVHEVRHEALVADFDGEVGRVLDFIGLGWDPAVRGFAERARARAVTPSDPQVARGLNTDGIGQWRRYEQQVAPVFPILEPWISHYGYPASPAHAAAAKTWGLGFQVKQSPRTSRP